MAESNQGIRALRTGNVQSILEGEPENDSQRSLPQVPNETIDTTSLSSVRQNLSSLFNLLRRGLASRISQQSNQPQSMVEIEVNTDQLSPNSLQNQQSAYQNTVRDLHAQNNQNAELLGRLEQMVMDKESEISWLRNAEMEKDLRIQAQQRDFQDQLIAEQAVREQVSGTLEVLWQELEALKYNQNTQNPMDISSSMDTANELNLAKQKAAEEKCLFEEKLAKLKSDYDQSLKDKKHMDDQMCKEREAMAKANKHQLQTIMLELWSLKGKQEKETTNRKVREKALLDNIKASIAPILKTDFKAGKHVGVGAHIKGLQEEITN